jgi:DNA (cytosine-5)-methyltransferase 1
MIPDVDDRGVAISVFSGAGGLDLGAEGAGYQVRAAVEWDKDAAATMEKNFDHLASPMTSCGCRPIGSSRPPA